MFRFVYFIKVFFDAETLLNFWVSIFMEVSFFLVCWFWGGNFFDLLINRSKSLETSVILTSENMKSNNDAIEIMKLTKLNLFRCQLPMRIEKGEKNTRINTPRFRPIWDENSNQFKTPISSFSESSYTRRNSPNKWKKKNLSQPYLTHSLKLEKLSALSVEVAYQLN